MTPTITLNPAAEKFIGRMLRFSGLGPDAGFRLTVSAGGCSGMNSDFSVEAAPKAGDQAVVVNGLRLFLPAESRLLLDGVTIDFVDGATQSGLRFHDPKAAGCGCSSSAAKSEAPLTTPGA
jgi:iron-sulfur cluster assembly accessory protein